MRLYHNPASPFVRIVRVLIAEAGATDRVALEEVVGHPTDPGSLPVGQNPLGKIPALALDDGQVLYDSRVICRYLDDALEAGLYPAAPTLWKTLTLEATAQGMLDAAVLMVYEGRSRAEAAQDPVWVEAQWQKVGRGLAAIERDWRAHLDGPMDIGVIAVGCMLGYLDFRHDARDWRAAHPFLAEWYAGFAKRASMQMTAPG